MNSLKIKHLKRIHFLVPEYDILTGIKTHCDRLEILREGIMEQGVQIFGFGEGKGPHRGFRCCSVIAFWFFYLLCPRVLENFFISALDCPFRVFTIKSFFHFSIVLLCTWKFKIYPERVNVLSRWFWLNNRDNSLFDYENFSRKNLFSLSIHIQSQ